MEHEAPLSPRGKGVFGWVPNHSAVKVAERDEVGRYLVLVRPVRRGEALLVEDALFLSPGDEEETRALVRNTLDPEAVAAAKLAGGKDWLHVSAQLSLVVLRALLEDGESPGCEEFQQLRGDPERWSGPAGRLWEQLQPQLRAQITREAMCEVYAIVANNAHAADGGRAGIFRFGSYAEHCCAPSCFKEVVVPVEEVSRPSSPCCPSTVQEQPQEQPQDPWEKLRAQEEEEDDGHPMAHQTSERIRGAQLPQLVIRALRDMAEGENVSISYIPEYLPTWKRREALQAGYDFTCGCERCVRQPEYVCAYVCSKCGSGPCCPTAPVTAPASLGGHSLRCEDCGAIVEEEQVLQELAQVELAEVVSEEFTRVFHPFHHKIFGMYLNNLQLLPARDRIQVTEQLMSAQRRLSGSSSHPVLGRLCELEASAQLEVGDRHTAVSVLRRAQELYGTSHRGPPDPGHVLRCYRLQMKVEVGPLGAKPRRLSKITGRSPSLPSLAEIDNEESAP
uniref:SET domain-containing protein n=1 Tax=Alexandrium monilatum TaxID=311494 RepID=A0A7S4PZM8_9DINO